MAGLKQLILAVVLVTLEVRFAASDDKTCGEKTCKEYEYCSDLICTNCSQICRKQSHNYDRSTCQVNCQGKINTGRVCFILKVYLKETPPIRDGCNKSIYKCAKPRLHYSCPVATPPERPSY